MNSTGAFMKNKTLSIFKFFLLSSILLSAIIFLTTCKFLTPGLGDEVDIDLPLVGLESHSNGDYVGGIINLTGFATDEAGITSVTVTRGTDKYTANYSNGSGLFFLIPVSIPTALLSLP